MIQELARTLHLDPTTLYLMTFSFFLLFALAAGLILNRVLHHWGKKLQNSWGELVVSLLESVAIPLPVLGALYMGIELLTLPAQYERLASKLVFVLVVLVVFYFPAKVFILFLRRLGQKDPTLERVTQPAVFIVRAIFALLALIIVLENLGISLTAVWTTLGVGSVAVALALQETLSNFFAGVYLVVDRPMSPGDYIKLDTGHEGFVVRVGWRSSLLRTRENNLIVIPNSTLAKAVITNYSIPDLRTGLVIPVSAAYGADVRLVEKVLVEVAVEAGREGLEGLLMEPPPVARLVPGFGASSLDFSLIVHVRRFTDQSPVASELRKRILARFEKEGIEMPFPTQTVRIESGPPGALPGGPARS